MLPREEVMAALRDVFVFAYLVPLLDADTRKAKEVEQVKELWQSVLARVGVEVQLGVIGLVKERLRSLIADCGVQIRWGQSLAVAPEEKILTYIVLDYRRW